MQWGKNSSQKGEGYFNGYTWDKSGMGCLTSTCKCNSQVSTNFCPSCVINDFHKVARVWEQSPGSL